MMPKLAVLARRRSSEVTSSSVLLKNLAAVAAWMSSPCSKAAINDSSPEVGHQPQFDLAVIGRKQQVIVVRG